MDSLGDDGPDDGPPSLGESRRSAAAVDIPTAGIVPEVELRSAFWTEASCPLIGVAGATACIDCELDDGIDCELDDGIEGGPPSMDCELEDGREGV